MANLTLKSNRLKWATPNFLSLRWTPAWTGQDKTAGAGYLSMQAWGYRPTVSEPSDVGPAKRTHYFKKTLGTLTTTNEKTKPLTMSEFGVLAAGHCVNIKVKTTTLGKDLIESSFSAKSFRTDIDSNNEFYNECFDNFNGEKTMKNTTSYPMLVEYKSTAISNGGSAKVDLEISRNASHPMPGYNCFAVNSPYEGWNSKETVICSWDLIRYPQVSAEVLVGQTTGNVFGKHLLNFNAYRSFFEILPFNFSTSGGQFSKTDVVMTYNVDSSDGTSNNFMNKSAFGVKLPKAIINASEQNLNVMENQLKPYTLTRNNTNPSYNFSNTNTSSASTNTTSAGSSGNAY